MDTTYLLDSGNTAWIIVATILVLLMTIPGIALFYGGLVRQKNILSIVMQSLLIVGAVSVLWGRLRLQLRLRHGADGQWKSAGSCHWRI